MKKTGLLSLTALEDALEGLVEPRLIQEAFRELEVNGHLQLTRLEP